MGPVGRLAVGQYRRGLDAVERGDFDAVLRQFDPGCSLTFVGDSPLGAKLRGHRDIRRWFERFARLLPQPRFEIQQVVISGPVWRQQLASHVFIHSTVNGEPYRNQFAHFLHFRWGKVVDDLIIEDTQMFERACRRMVAAGVAEAGAGPLESAGEQGAP